MKLIVNGNKFELNDGNTIISLLEEFQSDGQSCAVAVNNQFVPRGDYATFEISEGDCIEILSPHPGG
jgi:sulfur carrier protein